MGGQSIVSGRVYRTSFLIGRCTNKLFFMKKQSLLKVLVCGLLITTTSVSCIGAKTDFNEVGKQMLIVLRNTHYKSFEFDEKLGEQFFNSYIDSLDAQKHYFLAEDIDKLRLKYGKNMHQLLLGGESMEAAIEIHTLYRTRANQRIKYAQKLLDAEEQFTFDTHRTTMLNRKDAQWPNSEEEAEQIWRDQVEQVLLREVLRRETIAELAKKQGKKDPLNAKKSPGELISLRYTRIIHGINEANTEEIAAIFLSAIAKSYDPHTDYLSMSDMERFMSGMQNALVGIGALLQAEDDGATKITGIVVGGPADKQGELKLNDRIVGVDTLNVGTDEATVDIMFERLDRVVDLIRGEKGSDVRLKVEPANGAPGEVKFIVIKRDKVEMKESLASAEVIKMTRNDGSIHKMGFMTLPGFYADFEKLKTRCSTDIKKLLLRLKEEKIEGLVLDLRGNGGGSLEEVRRITGYFTGSGPVVQVRDMSGQIRLKDSSLTKPIYDGPLVVLIDKSSASASEILAGALQDYNRAVIIGDTSTFGKGTVQQTMEIRKMMPFMSDVRRAGVLKPTIQKFYRVSGETTQLKGVESDIVLPSIMDAFEIGEKYLDNPLVHDKIRRASGYVPLNRGDLFLPVLTKKSTERVKACEDFTYITEDIDRVVKIRKENHISLNKKQRRNELTENEARTNKRNEERRIRFAKMEEADKKTLRLFRLDLADLQREELEEINPLKERGDYMREAKDDVADLDDTPEWPSSLDPVKRESISILSDLVEVTERARMAGALQNNKG